MEDHEKTREQLLEELSLLRHRVATLEVVETERTQNEKGVRESEGRFRSLFQDSPVGAVVVSPNGRFIQVNRAFCDFLGHSEQELVGKTVLSVTHPEEREASSTAIRQAAELGPRIQRLDKRYLQKNGQVVWGEVSSTLICDVEGKPSYLIAQVLDISERKRAEEGLRNSERTLRTLMDASPESILLFDTDETILFANATMARRFGTTADKIVGHKSYDLVSPELAAKRMERLQEVVRTGKAIRFEDERSERCFDIAMHPIFDEQGNVAAVAVLAIDQTERKQAEVALKKAHDELERRVEERTAELTAANEELQAIYDGMIDGLLVADLETKQLVRANAAMCRLLGYSEEELLSMTVVDIHPPETVSSVLEKFGTQQEGQRLLTENRPILRKDGSVFLADISNTRISYQGRPCVIGLFRDITERKQAQEALRASHDEIQAIYDGMVDGLLMADIETQHFVRANASICQMLGYSEKGLLSLSVKDIHPEADLPFVVEQFRALAEGRLSVSEEIPVLRKDGTVVYAVVSTSRGTYSGRRCVVGFFRDVTERRQDQEALRQSRDELQNIYDQVVDGIIIVDIEKPEPIRANAAICRMLGYSEQEMKTVVPAQVHPSEAMPEILDHLQAVAEGRVARFDSMPFLRRDGSVFYADVVSSRILYNQRFCRISFLHDVTERKRAEEAIAESEAKYRHLVETTDTGYLILDEEGRVVDANTEYVRLTGHHGPDEILGRRVVEWTAPYDIERNAKEVANCLRSGGVRNLEVDYIGPSGKITPIEINGSVIVTQQGRQIVSLCRDITERKQAQEAIRQSEEKHRGLLEACPDAVVMTDLNGRFLFASRQASGLSGLSDSEELVGQSVFDYVTEDDRRRLADNFSRLAETGVRRQTEYTVFRQDGTQIPTEISSALIRDAQGQPIAVMAAIRDITERKRAEEALRQVSERLSLATGAANVGIWDIDVPNDKLVWDDTMFRLYGITPNDFTGAYEAWQSGVHPDDLSRADAEVQMALRGEKDFDTEFRVVWLDKSVHWIKANATVQRDASGRPVRMLGTNWDITERKRAQELLQKEHRTLKYLLQSSDHERQLIAYEIHDGLAQHLAGAIMQFQTYSYQQETNPKLASKAYDAGMTMLQQGHFESRRLIAGVRPPILDESGVVAAVGHLVHEQGRLDGPKIEYRSRVDFDRLVPTLENSIYRIAQEGLANACQHSKSEKVRVSVVQHGDRIQIEVRDWGVGFDTKSIQENRFGLEGIRQRARLLGGKCSIRSRAGKGTRIIVELPVVVRE